MVAHKKILLFLSILIFVLTKSIYADTVRIKFRVNEEIITNYDIKNEYNYLLALNKNFENLKKEDGFKIAEKSLIKEKIKTSELKKFYDFKKINDTKLVNPYIENIINRLNLKNIEEFENYIGKYNLKISDIRKKLYVEVLWNQLILGKYNDKINIDEKKIIKKIKINDLNKHKIFEYDLSEIVFEQNNKDNLTEVIIEIQNSIQKIGFKNTALKYSISNTASFGGSIGKVKENQLSPLIRNALNNLNENEYSRPLKIGNKFVILFINSKKIVNEIMDEAETLKMMIESERQKQLQNFSQIYFSKIKINSVVDEL